MVKEWILKIALTKLLKRLVQLTVAKLMALGLGKYGIEINPDLLMASMYGLLELVRNWAKVKYNLKWL